MMPGRARRDKRVAHLTAQHRIHRRQRTAHTAQRRVKRAGRHPGIGIELHDPLIGHGGTHPVDMRLRMAQAQIVLRSKRRLGPHQIAPLQRGQDMAQPRNLFGVALRREMIQAIGMGEKRGGHDSLPLVWRENDRAWGGLSRAGLPPDPPPWQSCRNGTRNASGTSGHRDRSLGSGPDPSGSPDAAIEHLSGGYRAWAVRDRASDGAAARAISARLDARPRGLAQMADAISGPDASAPAADPVRADDLATGLRAATDHMAQPILPAVDRGRTGAGMAADR